MALECESIAEAILSFQHFVLFKTCPSIKICQKMFMAWEGKKEG